MEASGRRIIDIVFAVRYIYFVIRIPWESGFFTKRTKKYYD